MVVDHVPASPCAPTSRHLPGFGIFVDASPLYAVTSGLGLTLLVSSVAKMIEARNRTRRYWVHTCWLAFLFVVNVTSWLSLWAVKAHPT